MGRGRVSSLRTLGPPGAWITAAFIVDIVESLVSLCVVLVCVRFAGLISHEVNLRRDEVMQ